MAVLFNDVTGRRQMEDALRSAHEAEQRSNRAKDEFLAMLGHELRNPLAPIRTALQVLHLRGERAPELGVIDRQVSHLTRLVDDLLDVSRITHGTIELRRQPMALREIVQRASELAGPLLEQRRNRLDVRVPDGIVIDADRDRMAQVVSNLLSNASKYRDIGSRIRLTGERDGDRARVIVEDEGSGISPEMHAAVFEPFVQQPQSLDRTQGGLGLGLAIFRTLVAAHGGNVRIDTQGSTMGAGSSWRSEQWTRSVCGGRRRCPPRHATCHGQRTGSSSWTIMRMRRRCCRPPSSTRIPRGSGR